MTFILLFCVDLEFVRLGRIFEVSLYVNISVPLQQTSKDVNEYKFKLNEVIPGIHLW